MARWKGAASMDNQSGLRCTTRGLIGGRSPLHRHAPPIGYITVQIKQTKIKHKLIHVPALTNGKFAEATGGAILDHEAQPQNSMVPALCLAQLKVNLLLLFAATVYTTKPEQRRLALHTGGH